MTRSARTWSARAALSATLVFGATACGGSGSEAKSPDAEKGANGETSSADFGATGDDEGAAEAGPKGQDCSDGTCFECGDGICPKGAYCDQNAEGGAACAWLPECSGTAACDCITGVLKGCACDDASGGPIVSCP